MFFFCKFAKCGVHFCGFGVHGPPQNVPAAARYDCACTMDRWSDVQVTEDELHARVEAATSGGDALDNAHTHGAFEVESINEDSGGEGDAVAAEGGGGDGEADGGGGEGEEEPVPR